MMVTFIGMSGSGKTHWSKRIANELGYERICCDDIIETRLTNELESYGSPGIQRLAKWLGFPSQDTYQERQLRYLSLERQAMKEILESVDPTANLVMDTTGSVIHTGKDICQRLHQLSHVVHFATPAAAQETMLQHYLTNPKPVIWGQIFRPFPGESEQETIQRCYSRLLYYREQVYEKWGEQMISRDILQDSELTSQNFMDRILNFEEQNRAVS